jgi:phosphatidylglycerophosphate synthase
MNYDAGTRALGKELVDGALCGAVYRPLSRLLSKHLARYISANIMTIADFGVGLLAAACFLAGFSLFGAILIQLFSILSCADGDIARLRRQTSQLGDYFDTIVDRSIEFLVVAAVTVDLAKVSEPRSAYLTGLFLGGGIFLITTSAAKFRSTFGQDYPKRRLEPVFSWVSAGSDARLAVLSLGAFLQAFFGSPLALLITLQLLCVAIFVNLALRLFVIWSRSGAIG